MATQAQQPNRIFQGTDADMISNSKQMRAAFVDDLADFTLNDPSFDAAYATNWQDAITHCEDEPTDEMLGDQEQQLSDAVEAQMVLCRNKFQDAKRFIQKAFPDNQNVWNEFGFDNYGAASNKQSEMIIFMRDFAVTAAKYTIQLNAANYTVLQIAGISTLKGALDDADQAQNNFIRSLPEKTAHRIELMNTLYSINQDVNAAAHAIYRYNAAKLGKYLLPGSDVSTSVIVNVTRNGLPVGNTTVLLTNTSLAGQQTDVAGNAQFNSINMPNSVDITVSELNHTPEEFNGKQVTLGQSNTIEVVLTL